MISDSDWLCPDGVTVHPELKGTWDSAAAFTSSMMVHYVILDALTPVVVI